ncbi:alcohol dehydrogenase [Cupriavidus sp. UYMU48A]|nr:alcohol dehydrogenase [Cupriavidus sp. UYMU48A]
MNPLRLVRTVLWGFLGLRKGREHQRDLENMRPVPLILTGVTLAAGLVFCLLMVAKFVVASA